MPRSTVAGLLLLPLLGGAPLGAVQTERTVRVRVSPAFEPLPTAEPIPYGGFQAALRNGVFDAPPGLPAETAELIAGLRAMLAGDRRAASTLFDGLVNASDEGVRGVAAQARLELMFEAGRWRDIAGFISATGDTPPPIIEGMMAAGEGALTAGPPTDDRLEVMDRGQVRLSGSANGVPTPFYFDTGAAITTLTDAAAVIRGVTFPWDGTVAVSTATGVDRPARIGVVRELHVGEVVARNLPVLVFPTEDLQFTLSNGDTVRIDAILGWDVIRHARATLDLGNGRYTFTLSDAAGSDARGDPLVWAGYPIVRLHAATGEPLLFGLDTGSFNTSITDNLLTKLDVGNVTSDTIPIGGVGGFVETPVRIAENVRLRLSDHIVELGDVWTEQNGGADEVFFFRIDGVLGIDIARGCVLIVDARATTFELRCPPA